MAADRRLRIAVAGAGSMKYPIGKRDTHQQPDRAAVGLCAADRAVEHAVEFRLLLHDPAGDAVRRRRRGRRTRYAKWILREGVRKAEYEKRAGDQRDKEKKMCRLAPPGQGVHGHLTVILLANREP